MVEPVTIYRIEDASGLGPYYRSPQSWNWSIEHKEGKRPSPFQDGISDFYQLHFGFDSVTQMCNWIDEELPYPSSNFFVSTYQCSRELIKYGNKQIAFSKKDAKRLNTIPICQFLSEIGYHAEQQPDYPTLW